jgi:hypothetical protein
MCRRGQAIPDADKQPRLRDFADARDFNKTTVAPALLTNLPIGAIERAMVPDRSDQVMVLAKML